MSFEKQEKEEETFEHTLLVVRWDRTTSVGYKYGERLQSEKIWCGDVTQITLRNELLSQKRGSAVVLRDQIHKELENLID